MEHQIKIQKLLVSLLSTPVFACLILKNKLICRTATKVPTDGPFGQRVVDLVTVWGSLGVYLLAFRSLVLSLSSYSLPSHVPALTHQAFLRVNLDSGLMRGAGMLKATFPEEAL